VTDGTQAASFNDGQRTPNGVLSQTFATVPNTTYTLTFDVGATGWQTTLQERLQVAVQGNTPLLAPQTTSVFGQGTGTWWTSKSYNFVADGGSATLTFTDVSPDTTNIDLLLDNVRVVVNPTPPSPTPTPLPLVNANFESTPFDAVGTITGWTVGGLGDVADRTAEGASAGNGAAVFSAGGDFQGDTLSQTFSTAIGQAYNLDFDAGIIGVPGTGAVLQLRVQVFGTAALLDNTITPPVNTGPTPYDPSKVPFAHYHYTFTANSVTTTLQFMDVGTGNANADQILDTIVVAPVPSPTP
jgi:hypothetical protein